MKVPKLWSLGMKVPKLQSPTSITITWELARRAHCISPPSPLSALLNDTLWGWDHPLVFTGTAGIPKPAMVQETDIRGPYICWLLGLVPLGGMKHSH